MSLVSLVLGSMLMGQIVPVSPPSDHKEGQSSPRRLQASPADLVADALTLPPASALSGRPISILTLLSTVRDRPSTGERRQQLDALHAYWRLVEAVAAYRFCLEQDQQLGRLQARSGEEGLLRTARTASVARLREADLDATTAQHDLAALMMLPVDSPLPLPADRPHAGAYLTYFAELFSAQPAPDRAKLIDQMLPLRAKAIDAHAAAVLAAEDALDAAMEDSPATGRLATILSCLDELGRQRRAMMACVCRYNHDIADYALTVASPAATPEFLAGMLIKQSRATATPAVATVPAVASGVQPATYIEPLTPSGTVIGQPFRTGPTPAARSGITPAPGAGHFSDQQPPGTIPDAKPQAGSAIPSDPDPGLAPPQETVLPAPGANPPALLPRQSDPPRATPKPHSANKPVTANNAASNLGRPISLAECLRTSLTADRLGVIDAYWTARQRAVHYQILAERAGWLDALSPALLARGTPAAVPMLQLTVCRRSVEAARLDSQLDLIEAQYNLAARMGRPAETPGLLPSSEPFTGQFPFSAPAGNGSWAVRRMEARLAGTGEIVRRRAAAVAEAEAARTAAIAGFQSGSRPLDEALGSMNAQTEQALTFLQDVSEYNRAIAEYAVAAVPAGQPVDKLVAALMVQ